MSVRKREIFGPTPPREKTCRDDRQEPARTPGPPVEELVRQRLRERWLEENREAIAAYNEYFEKHPVFSAGLRRFA